jgi:hypothetical protein
MPPPAGEYAVGVFRHIATRHRPAVEIHCVFENESDAEKVAQIFGAELVATSGSNSTRHDFRFDNTARETVQRFSVSR